MKKILVPTDMSDVAIQALDVAVEIARHNDAMIELLSIKVYPTGDVGAYYSLFGATGYSIDDAWNKIMRESKEELNAVIAKYEGVKIKPVVEESNDHFVKAVLEHKADLIVMGSRGADGLKEFFVGSNSEEIVRMASCPVLIVKGDKTSFSPQKVVFTVDFTHEAFIKKATSKLPIKGAELHFLHVDTDLKAINYAETKQKMQEMTERLHLKNCQFEIQEAATVEEGILEYADKINADLIVMYTHGRKGISHFFRGSIAEDVVNHATVPVFTFIEA